MADTCKNCLYWNFLKNKTGECRKRSPLPSDVPGVTSNGWRITEEISWCGEFKINDEFVRKERLGNV